MRTKTIVLALAAALAAAGTAGAGGWATAGLAPPPDDLAAGQTWPAQMTILQHGRTPLDGVSPAVIVTNSETGRTLRFAAKPTGKPGVYRADVKLPNGGEWRYAVDDGFGQTHTFAPFEVGGTAAGASFPLAETLGALALGVAGAIALFLFLRRQRLSPRAVASS
jgi:hypothetical protein